ncbi:MAG TPA: glycine cleavage system protein GcvH [Candidatus Dormibacteraeota bacterium]
MATVNGCNLPDDLHYLIDKHVWARPETADRIAVGLTDVAVHLAGKVIAVSQKRVGRAVESGQSLGTVESGKWVGPVPAPVSGEIVEVNERLKTEPGLLNQDPYGEGWIVRLRPTRWEAERSELATGADGLARYQAKLEAENIRCGS